MPNRKDDRPAQQENLRDEMNEEHVRGITDDEDDDLGFDEDLDEGEDEDEEDEGTF